MDRESLRQPERDGAHPGLHVSGVRTVGGPGDHRRAGRGRPLRLLRRARDRRSGPDPAGGRHIPFTPPPPPLRGRPWSWIAGRPRLVDGFLVVITFLPGLAGPIADWIHQKPGPLIALSALLVPLQSLPLWWRRRYPLAVLCVVAIPPLIRILAGLSLEFSTAAVVFAVYAVSVYGGSRARLWVGGLAVVSIIIGVALTLTNFAPPFHSR